jgi:4-carboxymuconolactone decarboxylase
MTPAQREVAAEISAGPRGEVRGPFIALIHNPELASKVQRLGEQLRWKGKLPPRLKELAVLVTARRWSCQHEWVMHSKLALDAGLAPGVVEAIRAEREPTGMSEEERSVLGFCRELHATGRAGDAVFAQIEKRFGLRIDIAGIDLDDLRTLERLAGLIARRGSEASGEPVDEELSLNVQPG